MNNIDTSLFNLCFEHSDNLLLVLSDKFVIQNINPEAENILGWAKETVCNQKIDDIFQRTNVHAFITQDNPNCFSDHISYINNFKILWTIKPVFDDQNNLEKIFISGKKIPETSNKQFELLQLKNAIKNAPGLFYWKDINGVFLGCNEEFARLAGQTSSAEVIGKTDFDLIWKENAQHFVEVDKEVMTSGIAKLNHIEVINISTNKVITAITNKVPLRDNNGDVIGVLGVTTDISDQKEIEQSLNAAKNLAELASHAKTEFIANMSHDIRSPLTGVIVISEVMENIAKNPKEKEYARLINDSGKQLLNLLDGILDVISLDNLNDHDLVMEAFDLRSFIDDLVQLKRPAIKMKNLELKISIPDNIPDRIITDKTKLHRVLLNLLGNAIKFTPKGHVKIEIENLETFSDKAQLGFSIIDTGTGIPDDLQSRVFDRYFKDKSPGNTQKGNGIGLNLAQSYVGLLGGEIKLISKINQGSRFYFDLILKTLPLKTI